jgi:hypothetical protein
VTETTVRRVGARDGQLLRTVRLLALETDPALARVAQRFWLVPAIVLASTIPNALFIWNADALGRDRHSLLIGVLGRLSVWMLLLFAVDAYLSAPVTRPTGASSKARGTPRAAD